MAADNNQRVNKLYSALINIIYDFLDRRLPLRRIIIVASLLKHCNIVIPTCDKIQNRLVRKQNDDGGWVDCEDTAWSLFYLSDKEKYENKFKNGMLWLESERMLHLKIDSLGVETQRKVVKEEKKQRLDNQPYGSLLEKIFSNAYVVHPYRWTPIGKEQYIDKASIPEFMDFYKKYYVPDNATLTIAGDINIDQTKQFIKKYFGGIPKGKTKIIRPTLVEPVKTAEVRDVIYDNVQLPLVCEAYHIPAQGTPDYYAINMLTTLLSNGESSRLVKEIKDKQQKALFVGTVPLAMEDPGVFIVYGLPNMGGKAEDLEAAFDAEIAKVKENLISETEFQKIRNQVETEFVTKNSTVAGIAESLADYSVYFKDTGLINTEIDRYMKVTREDIKRVANQFLTKENRVVLYYLPKSMEKK